MFFTLDGHNSQRNSFFLQLFFFYKTFTLRYKPIIVFSAFIGMLLFGLMSWTSSKDALQFVQMSFGTFMACEIAYYTYIYAKVERSKYQLVTGHTRSAILAGRFAGAALAQILISFGLINYEQLNYISFGCKFNFPLFSLSLFVLSISTLLTFSFDSSPFNIFFQKFSFMFVTYTFSPMFIADIRAYVTIGECEFIFLFEYKCNSKCKNEYE